MSPKRVYSSFDLHSASFEVLVRSRRRLFLTHYAITVYAFLLRRVFREARRVKISIQINRLGNRTSVERDWRRRNPVIPLEVRSLSLAQDRYDRAGWTDGRRSRQGPMTGWSRTPAAFRGSFAVPRGAIYYRGSSRRGRSRFSPSSRKRTETRGEGRGSVQGLPENLYTEREGVVYMAEGRVDLIRWWFFNEMSCARHLRDRPWFTAPILRARCERTKERGALRDK